MVEHSSYLLIMKLTLNSYKEGQWFAVPLQDGGFALGLLARANPKTKIALGYFFGRKFCNLPNIEDVRTFAPSDAILIARFGDQGIIDGKWPILGSDDAFRRQDWSVPKFARIDLLNSERGILIEYDSEGEWTAQPIRETPCIASVLTGLPFDGMLGSVAMEAKLSHVLAGIQCS